MSVSAILIAVDPSCAPRPQVVRALRAVEGLTLGEPVASRFPAVLDTPSPLEDRRAFARIAGLPGVTHVDVVAICFDEAAPEGCPGLHRSHA